MITIMEEYERNFNWFFFFGFMVTKFSCERIWNFWLEFNDMGGLDWVGICLVGFGNGTLVFLERIIFHICKVWLLCEYYSLQKFSSPIAIPPRRIGLVMNLTFELGVFFCWAVKSMFNLAMTFFFFVSVITRLRGSGWQMTVEKVIGHLLSDMIPHQMKEVFRKIIIEK